MLGQLRSVVFDCPEPAALARFYAELLGGTVFEQDDTWVVLTEPTGRRLCFQYCPDYRPPVFPDPTGSQQIHLDIKVEDVDSAEQAVLALGARRVGEGGDFRVFLDPVGHPFCLVWIAE